MLTFELGLTFEHLNLESNTKRTKCASNIQEATSFEVGVMVRMSLVTAS